MALQNEMTYLKDKYVVLENIWKTSCTSEKPEPKFKDVQGVYNSTLRQGDKRENKKNNP